MFRTWVIVCILLLSSGRLFAHALPHLDLTDEPYLELINAPSEQPYLKLLLRQRYPNMSFQPTRPSQVPVQLVWTNQWAYDDRLFLFGNTNDVNIAHIGPMDGADADAEEASKRLMHQSIKHKLPYVDLYRTSKFLNADAAASPLLDSDKQLTAYGEFVTAQLIMHMLGFHTETMIWKGRVKRGEVVISGIDQRPLRPPPGSVLHRDMLMKQPRLQIPDLSQGMYALFDEERELMRATHTAWEEGLRLIDSPAHLSPGDDPRASDFTRGLRLRFQKMN